jgi:hypothetical protein
MQRLTSSGCDSNGQSAVPIILTVTDFKFNAEVLVAAD